MDLIQKESSSGEINEGTKLCVDCKTTKTPLWRSGPAGPKSLCNACGIRYRKKSGAILGLNKGSDKMKEKPSSSATSSSSTTAFATAATATVATSMKKKNDSKKASLGKGKDGNLSKNLRVRLISLGKEVALLQRQRSPVKRQRNSGKKLGEVEQAALLLMALSYGAVFA